MKILVITQKIDKNDPILGFFHNWVVKLSERFEHILIICLYKGESDLPKNVEVFSLGKESGENKLKYLIKFFYYSLKTIFDYDAVFVHMNQEYVLLGGIFWKVFGKKIFMWRNHKKGSFLTDVAALFCTNIFYTSKYSYTAKFQKGVLMPVGIDLDLYRPDSSFVRKKQSVLFLGRFDRVKRVDLFIEALRLIQNESYNASIYGSPTKGNEEYFEDVKSEIDKNNKIELHPSIPNSETPKIYSSYEIYVNLTESGSFDKTILEAASCGCITITTNDSIQGDLFNDLIVGGDPEKIADKIRNWLLADEEMKSKKRNDLMQYVALNHSLAKLVEKLEKCIKEKK